MIYMDAGLFPAAQWKEFTARAHKGSGGFGKLSALRLPQIWRRRCEAFFSENSGFLQDAGFDAFLARNPEEILWLHEIGVKEEQIISDHTVYRFNEITENTMTDLFGESTRTWSLELNFREISVLAEAFRKNGSCPNELVVYGRAPLMVTAQCVRKTSIGCDRRPSLMWLKDRTGALMPVRNSCVFCCNTIYNAVPTVLYDLKEETERIGADYIRYEFTTETPEQMKAVFEGILPDRYTRGHFNRGVL